MLSRAKINVNLTPLVASKTDFYTRSKANYDKFLSIQHKYKSMNESYRVLSAIE